MKTHRQANLLTKHALAVGEAPYKSVEPLAAGRADLHHKHRSPTLASLLKVLPCLETACRLGRERYRQRRQLLKMDDRELKDIGITREQAEQEARKPIWKD